MRNIGVYISRAVSAFCLFLILAEANVWLDTIDNTVLVLGYRLFILLTPIFFLFFKNRLTFHSLFLVEVGLFLWVINSHFVGTILIALGLAVSGYMLKYYSAATKSGASGNKIALNLGSIFSGVAILFTQNKEILISLCVLFIIFSFLSFLSFYKKNNIRNLNVNTDHFSYKGILSKRGIAWAIIGFVIGVKLISIVSILPQFLIRANSGLLPHWYGWMLILNCSIVIFLQIPVMAFVSRFGTIKSVIPLMIGMIVIAMSYLFRLDTFVGAFLWTFLLSAIECTISYLDKLSRDDGFLLLKESSVGIGSAATVYLVRFIQPDYGSMMIGVGSLVLLAISILLFAISSGKPTKTVEVS